MSRPLVHRREAVPYPVPSLQPRRGGRRVPAGQGPWNYSSITRGRAGAAAARGSGGVAVAPVLLQHALDGA